MLEEIQRKEVDKKDKFLPQSFEQLIQMYDLEKIWPYLEKLVNFANNEVPEWITKTANNIEEIEEEIDKSKNYIVATISTAKTLSTANTDFSLNLDTIVSSNGNLLTLDDGAVVIGQGISAVEVSGGLYIGTVGTAGAKRGIIKKNGVNETRTIKILSDNYQTMEISPITIPVQQGDIISLVANSNNGTTTTIGADSTITKLVVKVIK